MKLSVFLITIVVLLVSSMSAIADIEAKTNQITEVKVDSARANFKLPKLFGFERFKRLYSRTYKSFAEELRRAKLFLARAWKVFVSSLKYKSGQDSKYLAINPWTDRTPEERLSLSNFGGLKKHQQAEENVFHSAQLNNRRKDSSDELDASDELQSNTIRRTKRALIEKEIGFDQPEVEEQPEAKKDSLLDSMSYFMNYWTSSGATDIKQSNEPDEVFSDLRDSGCLTPIKAQGWCESCYAFAVVAMYEYHHCRQTGELVSFSEQFIVDCDNGLDIGGCKGSDEDAGAKFVSKYGLELTANYPYNGIENECPYEGRSNQLGHLRVKNASLRPVSIPFGSDRDPAIVGALQEHGPLFLSIFIYDEFLDFGGGVDKLETCDLFQGRHAMSIVGHGREDGQEYWLARNSMGEYFGDDGYYKLSKAFPIKCLYWLAYVEPEFEFNVGHNETFIKERTELRKNFQEASKLHS